MPRLGRVVLPNYPHHVVEKGHNKQVVFAEAADYRYYLSTLEAFKDTYGVKVYGFCLMTNHILCEASHNRCNVKSPIM